MNSTTKIPWATAAMKAVTRPTRIAVRATFSGCAALVSVGGRRRRDLGAPAGGPPGRRGRQPGYQDRGQPEADRIGHHDHAQAAGGEQQATQWAAAQARRCHRPEATNELADTRSDRAASRVGSSEFLAGSKVAPRAASATITA